MIHDRAKINVTGNRVQRLSGNYFEPCPTTYILFYVFNIGHDDNITPYYHVCVSSYFICIYCYTYVASLEEGTVNYCRSLSTKNKLTYSSTHSNLPCSLSTSFFPRFKVLHLKIKSKRKTKTNLPLNTMSTIHKIQEQVRGLAIFFGQFKMYPYASGKWEALAGKMILLSNVQLK